MEHPGSEAGRSALPRHPHQRINPTTPTSKTSSVDPGLAGQAACVAHVAEHDLGAAAYAIKAAQAADPDNHDAARLERNWQRAHLPARVRALVLEDQARRNAICWYAFTD
ncbi:MAG: putative immunity protein [Dermatophilaceae bacterium]